MRQIWQDLRHTGKMYTRRLQRFAGKKIPCTANTVHGFGRDSRTRTYDLSHVKRAL